MRVLLAVTVAAVAAWLIVRPPPEPVPPHTYGDTVRERCAREAGPEPQSQKDCVDRHLLTKVFERNQGR